MILLADCEGPDQSARMRRLIWAFAIRIFPKTRFRMVRANFRGKSHYALAKIATVRAIMYLQVFYLLKPGGAQLTLSPLSFLVSTLLTLDLDRSINANTGVHKYGNRMANSINPDETTHQDLHCLQSVCFRRQICFIIARPILQMHKTLYISLHGLQGCKGWYHL